MSMKNNLPLNPAPEQPKSKILCLDISNYSKTTQFISCSIAVFLFFLLYGYMQELIFTIQGFQPYGWFLTLVQFGFYTIFGYTETKIQKLTSRRIPMKSYFLLALLTLGTMGFSNSSLGYLNYPTQVIFKCCKLIPVMAGSILIQGKKYGPLDFTAAVFLCVGLTLFTLADSQVQPNFNTTGIIMISMALLCDAVIGNVQEKSIKTYGAHNAEVVLYSYAIGFVYLFIIMLITGDLLQGFKFFSKDPEKCYGYAFIFSLTGYLGIQIVLTLITISGAFTAVTVTTFRKALTIVISFVFFSKPFTLQYVWSGLIVVLGIYINLYAKKNPISFTDLEMKVEHLFRYVKLRFSSRKYHNHYMSNI
ncbi:adenosine 3'-phospho 5'-phosphosulfate transporter 2 [Coccinella septempunctata]|uniref:adenosine 3'-phospho 5'-phosphosulfate transporter 2 n=1 Tax=Coccinella septempunctata TaxID=41139 RepID=UPI001D081515|nr:adenosine 3'-phospho 5'-phosphosulfate transporter 2 [Coccinella septempunctata]